MNKKYLFVGVGMTLQVFSLKTLKFIAHVKLKSNALCLAIRKNRALIGQRFGIF